MAYWACVSAELLAASKIDDVDFELAFVLPLLLEGLFDFDESIVELRAPRAVCNWLSADTVGPANCDVADDVCAVMRPVFVLVAVLKEKSVASVPDALGFGCLIFVSNAAMEDAVSIAEVLSDIGFFPSDTDSIYTPAFLAK